MAAQTAGQLADRLGVTSRAVTAAISRERRQGAPICAATGHDDGPRGYYLARSRAELEDYIKVLRHRSLEIARTLDGCLAALMLMEG